MKERPKEFRERGRGLAGFGCGFIVVMGAGVASSFITDRESLVIMAVVAIIAGLLVARFGEPMLARLMSWL
ncbi:MAG TPA: hypothetical protein VFV49_02420 [Thermoanaerobaculia bacterium]|nr:hypothetical protein [Thermoanaerobaculia bacterium]